MSTARAARSVLLVILLPLAFSQCKSSNMNSLEQLHIYTSAKHFPHSKERLQACEKYKDTDCLNLYTLAFQAKSQLFRDGRELALVTVLKELESKCGEKNWETNMNRCYGAIKALYFFDSEQEELMILEFFRKTKSDVTKSVLSRPSVWMHNRRRKTEWFFGVEEISGLTSDERKYLKDYFLFFPTATHGLQLLKNASDNQ